MSVDEGYEEGYRVITRDVMEEDAGNKIMSAIVDQDKNIVYNTPRWDNDQQHYKRNVYCDGYKYFNPNGIHHELRFDFDKR